MRMSQYRHKNYDKGRKSLEFQEEIIFS